MCGVMPRGTMHRQSAAPRESEAYCTTPGGDAEPVAAAESARGPHPPETRFRMLITAHLRNLPCRTSAAILGRASGLAWVWAQSPLVFGSGRARKGPFREAGVGAIRASLWRRDSAALLRVW